MHFCHKYPPHQCSWTEKASVLLTNMIVSACVMCRDRLKRQKRGAGRRSRNELLLQGAHVPTSILSALFPLPMKHSPFQCLATRHFSAVPAISLAIWCADMLNALLVGSSATSTIVGCVVVDVEMAVYVASNSVFALESACAHTRLICVKKLPIAGRCGLCVPVCSIWTSLLRIIYNGSTFYMWMSQPH